MPYEMDAMSDGTDWWSDFYHTTVLRMMRNAEARSNKVKLMQKLLFIPCRVEFNFSLQGVQNMFLAEIKRHSFVDTTPP